MKNFLKLVLFIFAAGYLNLGKAQFCEFDTLSGFGQTRLDGLVQAKDKSFFVAGRYGIGGQSNDGVTSYKQSVFLRKVDTCNQKIWEINIDSTNSPFDYYIPKQYSPNVLKKSGDFYVLSMGVVLGKDIVYKFDEYGNVISLNPIDKALFGSVMSENKFYDFESLGDSIQILHKDSNEQIMDTIFIHLTGFKPQILELKKTNSNSINLLVKSHSNDSNYKWLIIDSLGNKWYDLGVKSESGKLVQLTLNSQANGLFGLVELPGGKQFKLIHYDAQGGVLFDNSLSSPGIKDYAFLHVAEQGILLRFDHVSLVFNNDLQFIKSDTLMGYYELERPYINAHNAILSEDNQVLQVGFLESRGGISSFPRFRTWVKKSYLITYVKDLSIEGPSSIFIREAYVLLKGIILPNHASNKTLIWSVDDTSIAFISSFGFLSFRKWGNVTVKAQAADGSMVEAQKKIFIYPVMGLLGNENDFNVQIFPNPASTSVQIQSKYALESSYLADYTGRIIEQFGAEQNIDVSQISPGIYFLNISTNKGQVIQKLLIEKP
ncbi:MAG: T9SS type A sorting domain-containing protein [Bacteroidia bacterium]|nr:T9SS type A sorting domain-containing protein [Bacteroidia bacterium]